MNEKEQLELALKVLDEHKAEDLVSIDVSSVSPFATFTVLATCPNARALDAILNYLEEAFQKAKIDISVKEGEPDSGWVLFQGGEILVHLLLQGNRKALNLEEYLERHNSKANKQ